MKRLILGMFLLACGSGGALADDPCDGWVWNVKAERALFSQPAKDVLAAKAKSDVPSIDVAAPYRLTLADQDKVQFVAGPGKRSLPDGAHGGMVRTRIAHAGRYRVALDSAAWIDVVVDGQVVPSQAFNGRAGCDAPHKVVEYDLPAAEALIQISASQAGTVRVTVTESPATAH